MGGGHSRRNKGPDHELVVEIIRGECMPKADAMGTCDPYIIMWLKNRKNSIVSPKCKTLFRRDTLNPVWNSYEELLCETKDTDVLRFEAYDHDRISMADHLGWGELKITDLPMDYSEVKIPLKGVGRFSKHQGMCIYVRRVPPPKQRVKTMFIIRHGESKWNEAQANINLGGMMHFDHGLNAEGVEQCRKLNAAWKADARDEDEAVQKFMQADIAYCSPLTRAVQTALVSLQHHPVLKKHPLRLLRTVREVKNLGGLDTVGKESGDKLIERVRHETKELIDDVDSVMRNIDVYDACQLWWTPVTDADFKHEVHARFEAFLRTIKYSLANNIIVVGHSLYFKALCTHYMSTQKMYGGMIGDILKHHKLDNGACVCLEVDFTKDMPKFTDGKFMFGTTYAKHGRGSVTELPPEEQVKATEKKEDK